MPLNKKSIFLNCRVAKALGETMHYRFYLLDEEAHVRAGESFSAANDHDAVVIAGSVHFACSDAFPGYEVWRGTTRISAVHASVNGSGPSDLEAVVEQHQESVLDLEDRLQRTFNCVNRSQRLLEISTHLRRRWPV